MSWVHSNTPAASDQRWPAARALVDIPAVSLEQWRRLAERARAETAPIVIKAALSESIAVKTWTPDSLAERFGDMEVDVAVDLPVDQAPYLDAHDSHGASMTLRELVERLKAGQRCYLNQASLGRIGNLGAEIDVTAITVPPVFGLNLWLGGQTRSGLHFDGADNFLVQIFGRKRAVLVAPRFARALHPLPDNFTKSALSPGVIEGETGGPLAAVPRWRYTLAPGDALFIPRGWWHYLASVDLSISVNAWHGDRLGFKSQCAAFLRSGPATWARTGRDFVWCGVLGQPYKQRMFSPPPLGLDLYRRLRHARR